MTCATRCSKSASDRFFEMAACAASWKAQKAGYIGLWAQQATVRVDERGTEAAAGSAITAFVLDYGTVQMRVDRPFLFAIVHEPTELILLMGVVHAPPASAQR